MIEDFGLHDATLISVQLLWADGTCVMTVRHSQFSDCTLTFKGLSNFSLTRIQPWGPSHSINSACQRNHGRYEIEMQSGDLFKIDASDVQFASIATAAQGIFVKDGKITGE